MIHLDISRFPTYRLPTKGTILRWGIIKINLEGRKLKNSLFANTYQATMVKLWH